MAVATVRKARSEPRRLAPSGAPPLPDRGPPAVLLSKQDLDVIRLHALPSAQDLPRCLPHCLPVGGAVSGTGGTGGTPRRGASLSAGAGGGVPRTTPKVERRVRSAHPQSRRPPQPPAQHGNAPVPSQGQARGDRGQGADVAQRLEPRTLTPPPRQQRQLGAPLGGPQLAAGGSSGSRSASGSRGPASFSPPAGAATSVGSVSHGLRAGQGGGGLSVSGADPRRLPRPSDQVLRALEVGGPLPGPPGCAAMILKKDSKAGVAAIQESLSLGGLQVSGGAVPVCTHKGNDTPDSAVGNLVTAEEWSSSEEEEGGQAAEDGECDDFDYRDYRYQRYQEARARAEPPEPRRGLRARRREPARGSQVRGDSSESGCDEPWARGETPPRWAPDAASASSVPVPCSRGSTPCCEEESPDDGLMRVAEVLVKFYGLPGGVDRGLRLRNNAVIVLDEAWAGRQRSSQLADPPMMWVRGGRVYDFHGDRGTVTEFTNDLLSRQVEDDAVCRQRRREQGLMPFPFVAAPLKREEDTDDQAGAARDGGNVGGDGRRRHWL